MQGAARLQKVIKQLLPQLHQVTQYARLQRQLVLSCVELHTSLKTHSLDAQTQVWPLFRRGECMNGAFADLQSMCLCFIAKMRHETL